ncbi:carotenoid oxygenase family protein [Roseateles asaccharophilus]|uniref:Carotenoid cleavage dioxygenase n=1 Tax=Roseateles asaccharophilus TaxID=582607 RepID=A0ABU2AA46_9BURK|nr:carotenoid oxygenase family protein [Roseateles asaccharophilus]MDR7334079.1 carotenoid cleavage dioxygenase [Roseateles asaccharophilus]
MLQRRHWLAAVLAAGYAPELLAQGFASSAPELLPLLGLDGEGLDAADTVIEGRLPAGLRGRYFRNGPGLMQRAGQRYRHWFDGDGLVQSWTLADGRASHRARFVQTEKFRAEQQAGRFLLPAFGTAIRAERPVRGPDSVNVANTSVLPMGGRLYALWEGGSAHELDPVTLETRGLKVWSEDLRGMPFSAHPKVEPDGTVWNFGSANGRLVVYQLNAAGAVVRHALLDVRAPAMLHDFAVSQRFLVFLLAPITMDMAAVRNGTAMLDAMHWTGEQPTRVLVVDKADFSRTRVLEMPACNVFHFGNAWDDGRKLRVDYVQSVALPELNLALNQVMRGERSNRDGSTPRVLEIDLQAGRLSVAARDESVEFPVVDPRFVARRHRHVWYPMATDIGDRWGFNGLMRLDIETGARERFSFGAGTVVEEHVLVPKPGSSREGEGWLVGMGYDIARRRSFLSVFDALRLANGPLARAWLPYAVPYGFHGKFHPA